MYGIKQDKLNLNDGIKTGVLMCFILFFSVSCGKKGPLYMPKDKAKVEQPAEIKNTEEPVNNTVPSQPAQK